MDLELSHATDASSHPVPLTERILKRLGRPRWLWIVVGSLVPLVSRFVFATAIRISGQPLEARSFLT